MSDTDIEASSKSLGDGALDAADVAEHATVHALLNCYLRETDAGEVVPVGTVPERVPTGDVDRTIRVDLDEQGVELFVPLAYESPTARHLFDLPAFYCAGDDPRRLDATTLATLLAKELALAREGGDSHELVYRVLLSRRNVERFVRGRRGDESLTTPDFDFRDAEQSLVFGHLLHPTPKSRQGMSDDPAHEPELRGAFPLHYFRVDPELIDQASARDASAVELVKRELHRDGAVDDAFVERYADDALVPAHPQQADHVLGQPHVRELLEAGRIDHLGPVGRPFYPTTSVRTLYSPSSSLMVKCSLPVKITNSLRTNKRDELDRGVAITELLDTELGAELHERFPGFDVVRDPAYLTVDAGAGDESGFETILRENPFQGEAATRVGPVVALCQDGIDGPSRLARIVRHIAEREGGSTRETSEEWFRRYLERSIRPILWLYLARGLGIEAHQQNAVLRLDDDGYPERFYYRDNQGYYLSESQQSVVEAYLPDAAERMGTLCPDAVADERIRYYVVLNNAFGVINAFGYAGLVGEGRLLGLLRDELEACRDFDRASSSLLDDLLTERRIPCKANLLTRFHDMDELVGSLENQSVYADVDNPLVTEREGRA